MTHGRLPLLTAAAIVVTTLTPASAQAAVPARTLKPADTATPSVVRTVYTDVNGDGKRDTVTLTYLGSNAFTLTVKTTTGKTSTVRFTSHVSADVPASASWYGASAMDGRSGSELIVARYPASRTTTSDDAPISVYTWRSGKLAAAKVPASPWGRTWKVGISSTSSAKLVSHGYRFFSKGGHRYVDVTRLTTPSHHDSPWKGTITRSVWRNGHWVKVSTRKAAAIKHGSPTKWTQVSVGGPMLLLKQLLVDANGDGTNDLVGVYQGTDRYTMTVTAAGVTASVNYTADDDALYGASAIDGVAGADLILETNSEEPEWRVIGWRDGKLVDVPGPYVPKQANPFWLGEGDDNTVNYATGVEDGVRYIVCGDHWEDGTYDFVKSKWQNGGWVKDSEWSLASLTPDQQASFHTGFTATDLVRP